MHPSPEPHAVLETSSRLTAYHLAPLSFGGLDPRGMDDLTIYTVPARKK